MQQCAAHAMSKLMSSIVLHSLRRSRCPLKRAYQVDQWAWQVMTDIFGRRQVSQSHSSGDISEANRIAGTVIAEACEVQTGCGWDAMVAEAAEQGIRRRI